MTNSEKSTTVLDPRAVALVCAMPAMQRIRTVYAFQALGLPKGMLLTRGFTRTRAADMINDLIGIEAVTRSSRPPLFTCSAPDVLATYLGWAIAEAERRNPGLYLEVVEAPLYCTTDDEQEAHADIMGKLDA